MNWGGAQRYVYDLATDLPKDYDVTVAAGGNGILVQKLKAKSVRVVPIQSLTRDIEVASDLKAMWELYKLFRKERPDIVHLNSSKAGGLGALAARFAGVRHIIFTVHGWAFNEPVPKTTSAFRWLAAYVTLLLCHRNIVVSHFAAMQSPAEHGLVIIHNGIGHQTFLSREEARKEICARAGISEEGFIVGTIAELHANKGIDILIEATYLVDNIQVVVIGEGEEREALEKLIADLKLTDRVHLIGFIPDAAKYLKAFDTFALPSRTEALGYVLLEAGMAEVPVIASAVGGIPEVIYDQLTGDLVHAFNDEALAESLEEFKTTPNTRARYAEALKEHVLRYFNLDDMVRKTVAVYND